MSQPAAVQPNASVQLAAVAAAANAIIITDRDGLILQVNPAFCRLTGYSADEVVGQNPRLLKSERHSEAFYAAMWERILAGEVWRGEITNKRKDGSVYVEEMTVTPVREAGAGEITHFIAIKQDITGRKEAEEKLRLAAKVFENIGEGIVVTDAAGRIEWVNRAFTAISGYSEAEAVGNNPSLLQSGKHDAAFYQEMWSALQQYGRWQGEIWNRRKNGEIYPEWLTITAIRDDSGRTTNYAAVFSDITARKQYEEAITHLAYHDALTGLPNRMLFEDRLARSLAQARRKRHLVAVLFLDLDRFKHINDTLGHAMGDLLLQQVAGRLATCLRAEDTVARMGGDEFTILLPEIRRQEGAAVVADKILQALRRPIQVGSTAVQVSTSIGIAVYPAGGADATTLLRNADAALYAAKKHGRDTFRFYGEDPDCGGPPAVTSAL